MKFIQIRSKGYAPGNKKPFSRNLTVNVSHIIKISDYSSANYEHRIITLSNGEDIHLGIPEYNTLIAMLQDDWKGIRVLSIDGTHYGV